VAALSGKDILIDEAGLDHDYFVPRQQSIVWWHFTDVGCCHYLPGPQQYRAGYSQVNCPKSIESVHEYLQAPSVPPSSTAAIHGNFTECVQTLFAGNKLASVFLKPTRNSRADILQDMEKVWGVPGA
jgi:hypothetical protein